MSSDEIMDMQDRAEAFNVAAKHANASRVLAIAGILALTHEEMKKQVLDAVWRYFGKVDKKWTTSDGNSRYDRECGSLVPGKTFESHVQWLIQQSAISAEQAEALEALKKHRDEVVHDLALYIMVPGMEPKSTVIRDALGAFIALDRFWRQWALDNNLIENADPDEVLTVDTVHSGAGIAIKFALDAHASIHGTQGLVRLALEYLPYSQD